MKNWYQKLMPTIKDVKPFVKAKAKELNSLSSVRSVMAWGPYSENVKKLSQTIKEVDFLIKTSFHSDDMLAITTEDDFSPLNMTPDELEDFGFDSKVVSFTKKIMKSTEYPSNYWVLANNKLLHWGPMMENHDEWMELKELAEKYASENTSIKSFQKKSQTTKDNWYSLYNSYLDNYTENMPDGWYTSKGNIQRITSSAILL
jgi:hypothetical protein